MGEAVEKAKALLAAQVLTRGAAGLGHLLATEICSWTTTAFCGRKRRREESGELEEHDWVPRRAGKQSKKRVNEQKP